MRPRFRSRNDGAYAVEGRSSSIRPGERVALVRASGSGESTLLRRIPGFGTPESGQVLPDGQDRAGLDSEAAQRQLGVVPPIGRLVAGTILDAVSGANAMPMGTHSPGCDGGGPLGQRQRLLIAGALVHRPRLLIFAEATSALDDRSQAEISENPARLGRARSTRWRRWRGRSRR